MTIAPIVRPFQSEEWRLYRDLRLAALADSPNAFASLLALEQPRTGMEWQKQLADAVRSPSDLPLVAELDEEPCGFVWVRVEPPEQNTARLYQTWVSPQNRRAGVGRLLLETAVTWARDMGVRQVTLAVTCGDTPAYRLYSRAGFIAIGETELLRDGSDFLCQDMRLALGDPGP